MRPVGSMAASALPSRCMERARRTGWAIDDPTQAGTRQATPTRRSRSCRVRSSVVGTRSGTQWYSAWTSGCSGERSKSTMASSAVEIPSAMEWCSFSTRAT